MPEDISILSRYWRDILSRLSEKEGDIDEIRKTYGSKCKRVVET